MAENDNKPAAQVVTDAANKFLEEIASQHSESVGKATEAFAKTNAMLRGTNDFAFRNGLAEDTRHALHNALLNYGQYMMTQYLGALQLTQDQVKVAAEASEKLLNEIVELNNQVVILTADESEAR